MPFFTWEIRVWAWKTNNHCSPGEQEEVPEKEITIVHLWSETAGDRQAGQTFFTCDDHIGGHIGDVSLGLDAEVGLVLDRDETGQAHDGSAEVLGYTCQRRAWNKDVLISDTICSSRWFSAILSLSLKIWKNVFFLLPFDIKDKIFPRNALWSHNML